MFQRHAACVQLIMQTFCGSVECVEYTDAYTHTGASVLEQVTQRAVRAVSDCFNESLPNGILLLCVLAVQRGLLVRATGLNARAQKVRANAMCVSLYMCKCAPVRLCVQLNTAPAYGDVFRRRRE